MYLALHVKRGENIIWTDSVLYVALVKLIHSCDFLVQPTPTEANLSAQPAPAVKAPSIEASS